MGVLYLCPCVHLSFCLPTSKNVKITQHIFSLSSHKVGSSSGSALFNCELDMHLGTLGQNLDSVGEGLCFLRNCLFKYTVTQVQVCTLYMQWQLIQLPFCI